MYEAIVTLVIPASGSEPLHTKVLRMEFDTEEEMAAAIFAASELATETQRLTS